jgi:hypothetical protein
MLFFGTTLFLGALLLFLIEPVAGKLLLPGFGGTPAVWNTCLLFFQLLLLGGYGYAHASSTRLRPRAQAVLQVLLLGLTLLALPAASRQSWSPSSDAAPPWRILALLSSGVGFPFFLLAATTPLMQRWLTRIEPDAVPYRLYALSNFGSLLGLVAYPFLIEPAIGLRFQTRIWSWCYAGFAVLCAAGALRLARRARSDDHPALDLVRPPAASGAKTGRVLWWALAATGSVLLMATTNQMCQDVAVVPFLWVLPLSIYLLTFILCFQSDRWYSRTPFALALAGAAVLSTIVLFRGVEVPIVGQVAAYGATLFIGCMVCHGELARLRPDPRHLTAYYFGMAGGGAAGAAIVTFLAPSLFKGFWEYPIGLFAACVLLAAVYFCDPASPLRQGRPLGVWVVLYCALVGLGATLSVQAVEALEHSSEVSRNFYGVLRVLEQDVENTHSRYTLMHGRIEHGFQYRDETRRYLPTSYYGAESGVGIAIVNHPRRIATRPGPSQMRVGIVGLGVGTIATYGEAGDVFRFFEINPEVLRISDKYFTYRSASPAKTEVVLGDARVSMERDRLAGRPFEFDVLAIDAFSGDAIPVHLLTRECFDTYWYHLKPDGILAFHISSRYLDLRPVVRGLAATAPGMETAWVETTGDAGQGTDSTDWVLVTRNRSFLEQPVVRAAVKPWPKETTPLLWTDDYSNVFRVLTR